LGVGVGGGKVVHDFFWCDFRFLLTDFKTVLRYAKIAGVSMKSNENKTRRRDERDLPVLSDSRVNRMAARSVRLMERAIRGVETEAGADREDWFARPFAVAEKLSDRLACAEDCIRTETRWRGYRGLLAQMDLDF
jgi:hypothetical protein